MGTAASGPPGRQTASHLSPPLGPLATPAPATNGAARSTLGAAVSTTVAHVLIADAGRVFARRFADAVAGPTREVMQLLFDATNELARAMRAAGLAPEEGAVALKNLLRSAGGIGWTPSLARVPGSPPPQPASRVYHALFRWWVEAFYADDTPSPRAG